MKRCRTTPSRIAPVIDALEPRRMFNAATLKHGLLTVYGSDDANAIIVQDTGAEAARSVTVTVDGQTFTFRSTGILRMRIFGYGGDDTITLGQTYTPNMGDVAIDGGDGNDQVLEETAGHKYNRGERVSVVGGAGADSLEGGAHTLSLDGGTDDDTLSGGAAGAVLNGGDGDDLVSANFPSVQENLLHGVPSFIQDDALGAVALSGGAGDDVIVGNSSTAADVQDTLSGGDGDDQFFNFSTDLIVDLGVGLDSQPAANQYSGNADLTQTATLGIDAFGTTSPPTSGVGNVGPKPRIFVSDANGTITMQGPAGSSFLLGDLLNASGYPVDKLGIPSNVTLKVNGFVSSLTGNQIAGYQINDGDVIEVGIA